MPEIKEPYIPARPTYIKGFETEAPELEAKGFQETLRAGFRRQNLTYNFLAKKPDFGKPDPAADVFEGVFDGKYEPFADRFVGAANAEEREYIKSQIDQELEDQETIAAAGWGGWAAETAGAILDFPTLIPVGAAYKGYSAGRGALRTLGITGAANAGVVAGTELGLHGLQETRTAQESLFAIGGSTILGMMLGGGVGWLGAKGNLKAAARVMDAQAAERFKQIGKRIDADTVIPVDGARDMFGPRGMEAYREFEELASRYPAEMRDELWRAYSNLPKGVDVRVVDDVMAAAQGDAFLQAQAKAMAFFNRNLFAGDKPSVLSTIVSNAFSPASALGASFTPGMMEFLNVVSRPLP